MEESYYRLTRVEWRLIDALRKLPEAIQRLVLNFVLAESRQKVTE